MLAFGVVCMCVCVCFYLFILNIPAIVTARIMNCDTAACIHIIMCCVRCWLLTPLWAVLARHTDTQSSD